MSNKTFLEDLILETSPGSFLLGVTSGAGSKDIRSSSSKVSEEGTTASSVGLDTPATPSGEALWGALRRNDIASDITLDSFGFVLATRSPKSVIFA